MYCLSFFYNYFHRTPGYSFSGQELQYSRFRPRWSRIFAESSLADLTIIYDKATATWSGLSGRTEPTIMCIGSGSGADVEPFLELGCKVYAVEPNAKFRHIATTRFAKKYPNKFISIDGDALNLKMQPNISIDLIVSAQSLHTFCSKITGLRTSEALVREKWRSILPDDNKNHISIWYYNLNPMLPAVIDLDQTLRAISASYAASKTTFLNAPLFEPKEFQHYIEDHEMSVSKRYQVDSLFLEKSQLMDWLQSYSFGPQSQVEKEVVMHCLYTWFARHKNEKGQVELDYVGFVSQGPLRKTPYFPLQYNQNTLPSSPISIDGWQNENLDSLNTPTSFALK